jgi:glycosyltransferase involved in cell wall biosynthesis
MSTNIPFFSVIIPTFNRAFYLIKALESVFNQTYTDYEIIVIDDGSTDETVKYLAPFRQSIRYYYQPNSGVSQARNAGIKNARGIWLAFLDSDDEWLPSKLQNDEKVISANPDLVAHLTNIKLINSRGHEYDYFKIRQDKSARGGFTIMKQPFVHIIKKQIFTTSLVAKREIVMRIGNFDPNISVFEDVDFALRLAVAGKWGKTDQIHAHVIRRQEPGISLTVQARKSATYRFECLNYILEKWYQPDLARKLTVTEQEALKNFLSQVLFRLGLEYLVSKLKKEAFGKLKRFLYFNRSLKSLVKYWMLALTGSLGARFYKTYIDLRAKNYRT